MNQEAGSAIMGGTVGKKVVVVCGPTASGKTRLAVKLARALNAEIINADSMQVYRGMDIGTAKPTPEERGGIPHHLLDVVEPDQEFNAAIYRSMALQAAADISSRGRSCLVVGGTGLYIKSLLQGLFDCSPTDERLRESLRRECEALGPRMLHDRLRQVDPESAERIHPNDRVRIIRSLEIFHLTGRPASELMKAHGFREKTLSALKLGVKRERKELYGRIEARSIAMVEAGLVQETEKLLRKGYSPNLKPMRAIGYRHMVAYLRGEWSMEEAIVNLQRDTRRYAKRQLTWFNADPEIEWVAPGDFDVILKRVRKFFSQEDCL